MKAFSKIKVYCLQVAMFSPGDASGCDKSDRAAQIKRKYLPIERGF